MYKIETAKPCDYLPKTAASDGIEVTIEDWTLDESGVAILDWTSDEDDQESLDCTSDEKDQKSLKANRMSLSKINSKENIENQIEGNEKGIASVEKELNLKPETTIVKKKDIEEEVQSNMERIKYFEKELDDQIRRIKETITEELGKRIKALEEEKQDFSELEKQLQEMKESLKKIEEKKREIDARIEKIEEENKEKDARIKKIEEANKEKDARIEELEKDRAYDQNVRILMQMDTTLQRNRCKYVLGEYFKEAFFYKYENIDRYIKRLVPARDQESAKTRLKELDEKCPFDQDLVDSLKTLKEIRITIVHPELSSEKIQQATEHLKEMNKITDEMVENIMELKALWETSEDLLRRRSAPDL